MANEKICCTFVPYGDGSPRAILSIAQLGVRRSLLLSDESGILGAFEFCRGRDGELQARLRVLDAAAWPEFVLDCRDDFGEPVLASHEYEQIRARLEGLALDHRHSLATDEELLRNHSVLQPELKPIRSVRWQGKDVAAYVSVTTPTGRHAAVTVLEPIGWIEFVATRLAEFLPETVLDVSLVVEDIIDNVLYDN
ncbi:MAG: hypothetical protein V1738_03000 [Patescibacteria group bacterium]